MHEVEINRQVSIILVNNQFSCRSHYLLEFMEYHFHKWSPPCTQMRTFGRQRQRMSSFTIPASCLAMTADWYIRTRSILSCSACELCIGIWMVFSDRRAYITASAGVHTSRIARAHTEPGRCAMHTMHISPICFFFYHSNIRSFDCVTVATFSICRMQCSIIQHTVYCAVWLYYVIRPKIRMRICCCCCSFCSIIRGRRWIFLWATIYVSETNALSNTQSFAGECYSNVISIVEHNIVYTRINKIVMRNMNVVTCVTCMCAPLSLTMWTSWC